MNSCKVRGIGYTAGVGQREREWKSCTTPEKMLEKLKVMTSAMKRLHPRVVGDVGKWLMNKRYEIL